MGAIGSTARSLAAKCQTNLVLSVRSAIFPNGETERQRSVAVGKWPCSRLLPMSWPGEASRPIACPRRQAEPRAVLRCLARAKHRGLLLVLADMRSIAASGILFLRARTTFFDCLASLRPSERSESAPPLFADRGSGVERVQSWRVSHRARAEPCRYLARREWFGACAWPRPSASVGSVKPGCLLFPSEERSDEVSMPDTALKIIRQPERLECANDVQTHETVIRARGVAKGPPSVTSVNQRWRPGARP